eukprot:CAMPEP_0116149182 /NCGR_PEP_ID=MMETSP0329-20121206/18787_1 /TAXON_ID=697910 /ORGANISM="Pseudo-nitzschia arenysensis, Strain B593" /LENGTH=127 /DNA_ID=CAMNT_0003645431 /DNA_START=34 /DNA_END=414 /DNA_ORIENTATION=-
MTMNHRRNVNNPFANKSRRTVGYSDQRYGSQQTNRGKKGFFQKRSTIIFAILGFVFLFTVSNTGTSYDDYNSSTTSKEKVDGPKSSENKTPETKESEIEQHQVGDKLSDQGSYKKPEAVEPSPDLPN